MSTLLERVKIALRVSSDAFDEAEIGPLITTALSELRRAGVRGDKLVTLTDDDGNETIDALVEAAVIAYVKAMFGYDNDEREQFLAVFDRYEVNMLNSDDYNIELARKDLADAVIADIPAQAYEGHTCRPVPSVEYDGEELEVGVDFWVSYANNDKPGMATVTIAGRYEYCGSVTRRFEIVES